MRLIPSVILCALLGVVYWVGATLFTDRIQNDITERSTAAISSFKPDVDLNVDGRDVTLTGLVNTEELRDEAKQRVDSVWGVRASQNQLAVRDPYDFNARNTSAEGLIISGTVDDPAAVDFMQDVIAPTVPKGNPGNTARPMINSGQKLALGTGALLLLREGKLKIDEQQLLLTGDADDEITKGQIEAKLRDNQTLINPLTVVTDINVVNSMTLACRTKLDSVIDRDTVLFKVDSAVISDRYTGSVSAYAELLQVCPGIIMLEAHADQDGSESYNQQLSQKRAEAVAQLLIQSGVTADRVQTFSFGETRPIASNENVHDKSYNRRVDLEYIHTEMPNLTSIQQPVLSSQSAE